VQQVQAQEQVAVAELLEMTPCLVLSHLLVEQQLVAMVVQVAVDFGLVEMAAEATGQQDLEMELQVKVLTAAMDETVMVALVQAEVAAVQAQLVVTHLAESAVLVAQV